MAVRYTGEIFASAALYSVSYFSDLPSEGQLGQKVAVTNESLFDNSYPVIVVYEFSVSSGYYWTTGWKLLNARCSYTNLGAVEFNSGNWVGTATISTSPNATILDTTYNESWTWNSTQNIFVPAYLGLSAIQNQKRIKGDSTTLESGWTSQVDATCTLVVDGGNKLFATAYGNSIAPTSRYSKLYFTDTTGTGTTNNFYMKCLLQRTTMTMGTTGGVNLYIRHDTGNGGRIVEFGDGSQTAGSITVNGKFMDRTTGWNSTYTATANRGDTWTSETLVQFRVIAGATAQVKIGTGGWHDIAVSTCRSGTAALRFEIGVGGANNGLNVAAMKFRYLQAIRYT